MITIFILFLINIILIYLLYSNKSLENYENNQDNNLFIIISKKVTSNMYNKYSELPMNNIIFISDQKPEIEKKNIYYFENNVCIKAGFFGMHDFIEITSWDKVFYYLKNYSKKYDYYWIIEDDIYLNKNKIEKNLENYKTNKSDALFFGWHKEYSKNEKWVHWNLNKENFKKNELSAAITQIIRISDKFSKILLEFQNKNKKFIFHEILFASLVSKYNLSKEIIKRKDIYITSLKEKSLLVTKFNNNNKELLNYANNNMVIIHPFKQWYNY